MLAQSRSPCTKRKGPCISLLIAAALAPAYPAHAQRVTVSLDGEWEIEDGTGADVPPNVYTHVVPVPGLVHSATPYFTGVDEYQSRELLINLVGKGLFNKSDYERLGNAAGITHQERNYFGIAVYFNFLRGARMPC